MALTFEIHPVGGAYTLYFYAKYLGTYGRFLQSEIWHQETDLSLTEQLFQGLFNLDYVATILIGREDEIQRSTYLLCIFNRATK